ncbi:hypothetical protein [Aquisalibacillus elongatus]|uniref:Uncharacterized protein n=1 Tax=Aquisalibacillus elongatus TaxID=485577 RepID=A0A3N5BWM8_9BACI|nr:hypothetical protein [Aquisalibacillus elongatus]RPF54158.1 hypothetical protein EDC24_1349 [Aquisalibacillus elongatus]
MLYEQWTYDGELIGYFDEDGLGHPDAGGTKEQVFYQFTELGSQITDYPIFIYIVTYTTNGRVGLRWVKK